jgi:hypothetical protein
MPDYTRAEINMIVDGEDLTQYAPAPGDEIEQVLNAARSYFEPLDYATKDVMESMQQVMRHGTGDFGNMFCEDFEKLFVHLSAKFPEAVFRLRCVGSFEFGDVYLREFKSGKISLSIGPFET